MAFINLADDEMERIQRLWTIWISSGEIRIECGHSGHHIWNKTVSRGYGRVGITFNMRDGTKVSKKKFAHVIAYALKDRSYNWDKKGKNTLDVSHLCGRKLCVNGNHLNLESRKTNNQRKKCHNKRHCFEHGDNPKCIFIA